MVAIAVLSFSISINFSLRSLSVPIAFCTLCLKVLEYLYNNRTPMTMTRMMPRIQPVVIHIRFCNSVMFLWAVSIDCCTTTNCCSNATSAAGRFGPDSLPLKEPEYKEPRTFPSARSSSPTSIRWWLGPPFTLTILPCLSIAASEQPGGTNIVPAPLTSRLVPIYESSRQKSWTLTVSLKLKITPSGLAV